MSASLKISVNISGAYLKLAHTKKIALDKGRMHRMAAEAVSKLLRTWFIARNSRSPTSNYWSEAAESIHTESDDSSGRVVVSKRGVAWHRYGGTIRAKPGKALAIPLRAAVKGIWPSEKFPNKGDAFVFRRKGKAFLAAREGKALRIFYLLVKSVSKLADRSVLPDDASIYLAASAAIRSSIRLQLARLKS